MCGAIVSVLHSVGKSPREKVRPGTGREAGLGLAAPTDSIFSCGLFVKDNLHFEMGTDG